MTLPPTSSDRSDSDTSPASGLKDPAKKEIAMRLVSAAENSSLCWKEQYQYIEYNVENNDKENRGYTGGIVGFTSKTRDMLQVVERYEELAPGNRLRPYIAALRKVNGTSSQDGLGQAFEDVWRSVANDPKYRDDPDQSPFRKAQNEVRDREYFEPAVNKAQDDKLGILGQFIYYDAWVMHGEAGALSIRKSATEKIEKDNKKTPVEGGDETEYLCAFLDARRDFMLKEEDHKINIDRVETMQASFSTCAISI